MKHFRDTLWRKMVFGKTRNFYREITENNCPKKKKLNALKNEVFEKLRIKKK